MPTQRQIFTDAHVNTSFAIIDTADHCTRAQEGNESDLTKALALSLGTYAVAAMTERYPHIPVDDAFVKALSVTICSLVHEAIRTTAALATEDTEESQG